MSLVLDPWVVVPLSFLGLGYMVGLARLRGASRTGGGVSPAQGAAFIGGWITIAFALLSPLDRLGGALFSAHMAQHVLLMLVSAPLLVLAQPLPVLLWAFPRTARRAIGRAGTSPAWRPCWRALTRASIAAVIYSATLWIWHAPPLYAFALENEFVHALQHSSFLCASLLFWWSILNTNKRPEGLGAAALAVFIMGVQANVLALALIFASSPWFPANAAGAQAWGLTALEDQQLGGAIMSIPGMLVHLTAGAALLVLWLRESEQRAIARERHNGRCLNSAVPPVPGR
ncbi:cytochrome c oxidase assembly protein [Microvirga roseola]|uniref:cytochrome c oxidase assembly protein n=1 Tax=Microvirga roseola TaxID=2883126 RepID=UPI001E47369A|nr:cytochrome c oxidase assembly protein [Microvirga roseola]